METLPLVTLRMLKPTVGIMSSEKAPVAKTLTKVLLPAFCRPTIVSSISCFQKRFRIHAIMSSNSFEKNAMVKQPAHNRSQSSAGTILAGVLRRAL